MATQVTVRITGDLGLDEAEGLLKDLERQTGLEWSEERRDGAEHLSGGIAELLLTVLLEKGVSLAMDPVVDRVRESVTRWRETRLSPPEAQIETAEVADPPEQTETEN
ncbi:hypothetical protein [Actinospica sp.]|jgi:hypothetical protein|uniref:hypothetical protein n=1 Tax=Actinospica sp. TaxID=1872142 RepID=UPI002B58861E|nr:hypothetical protein [Actinospica sp.]HWG25906.1 hypothetical protein [Actinospica sp.]